MEIMICGCAQTALYEDWADGILRGIAPTLPNLGMNAARIPLIGHRNLDYKAVLYNGNKLDLDIGTARCGVSAVYDLENKKVFYIDKNGVQSIEDPVRK